MHPAAVDVTIVHPLTNSNCLLPPSHCQEVIKTAEADKISHYGELCRNAGVSFIPAGFSTFGVQGPHAAQFITDLSKLLSQKTGVNYDLDRQLTEQLSVSVMKSVAKQLASVFSRNI